MSIDFQKIMRQLKLNITYYRKNKGLTQEELAELVFISRTHMSRIEALNTNIKPSLELIFLLADALDVEFVKLFESR